MSESTQLRIADLTVRINSADPELIRQINQRYDNFLDPASPSEITLDLDVTQDIIQGASLDPEIVAQDGHVILRRRDFEVSYDSKQNHGSGLVTCNMYSFDSFLRVLFSMTLMDRDGFLIHGSSVKRGDKSYVFYGVSGSGKTTVAKLSTDCEILSDEITVIRKVDGIYRAYGTPFWGEMRKNGENVSAPVAAFCLLTKDTKVFSNSLKSSAALPRLMRCILFFSNNKNYVSSVMDRCLDVTASVKCCDLHFLPNDSFWRVIADVA